MPPPGPASSARAIGGFARGLSELTVHGASLAVVGFVLVAVGQPIFTDDTWWHLAIGEIYAAVGPWLDADPFLFGAQGPPEPAAWLFDVALYGMEQLGGFQGLRVAHGIVVVAILGLAWSMLRRLSGSYRMASLGTAVFAALSAYRLFQLRPHLVTIVASLLLVRLLIVDGERPTPWRVTACALLIALWANAHGAFVLGPVLIAAAIAGLVGAAALGAGDGPALWRRARGLTIALGAGLLASFLNPRGAGLHGLYFTAGAESPELSVVADEWMPVKLFTLPLANLPPTPLSWLLIWGVLIATPVAVVLVWRGARPLTGSHRARMELDPALIAVGVAAIVGMLSAVRLLWMGIFPLLVIGQAIGIGTRRRGTSHGSLGWAAVAAAGAALLAPGFRSYGDWPMISNGVHESTYARPYSATKHHAHAIWIMRDAGLEGNLFNDYSSGNFLSYWLAPRIKVFVNGSLNISVERMEASGAVMAGRGTTPGETMTDVLDRYRVDLFFGSGTPWVPLPGRSVISTTTHLEQTPGWILVFRNMTSAVYLRDVPRNRHNLERMSAHYAEAGVPFDPQLGFEIGRVVEQSHEWAIEYGLIPESFQQIWRASRAVDPTRRRAGRERLASILALDGLYDSAVAVDREHLKEDPGAILAGRRLIWSLLHARRIGESIEAANALAKVTDPHDPLSRLLVLTARRSAEHSEDELAAALAMLPVFERAQALRVYSGFREPDARPSRD